MAATAIPFTGTSLKVNGWVENRGSLRSGEGSRSLSSRRATMVAGSPLKTGSARTHRRPSSSYSNSSKIQCVSVSDVGQETATGNLPLKEIPGTYGLPFFGAVMDRLDFMWFQQTPKFYEARRDKYNSTVFRTNMPPGPPFFPDPRVVCVVDEKSFPILFDLTKVEKKNVFVGTFMPNVKLTGGYRVLSYLDPSETKHTQLKNFAFEILKGSWPRIFPVFAPAMAGVFAKWEAGLKKDGKVAYVNDLRPGTYSFMLKAYTGQDPYDAGEHSIGKDGPSISLLWLLSQIAPISVVAVPWFLAPIVELFLHTFPVPPFLVKGVYTKLENFFRAAGSDLLDIAESKLGLERDEALQNLLFLTIFNSWGGIDIFFPLILKRLGATTAEYQKELAAEVRQAVKDNGGQLNSQALAAMPLVQSAVYEVLRIDPPVPFQYAKAKFDFVIESHEAAFQIKKGETIHGFMPVATRDPKVFDDPQTYKPKRFLGDEGKALLKYVLWSNGPQTQATAVDNKVCAGKDFVLTVGQLFVATIFNRYDNLQIDPTNDANISALKPLSS